MLAAWDAQRNRAVPLWGIQGESFCEEKPSLLLSPDERFIWWLRGDCIFVGQLGSREAVLLTDANAVGLSRPRGVWFDAARKLAWIGTPRGIVCCDYSGQIKWVIRRESCPIVNYVNSFVFAPDGGEVWCLTTDGWGGFPKPAVVFQPKVRKVREVPDTGGWSAARAVLFSPEGKRAWLSSPDGEKGETFREKRQGGQVWGPVQAKMPESVGEIDQMWLNSTGDELWASEGEGLLRIKLRSGEVSHYLGASGRHEEGVKYFSLAGTGVRDLTFTPDRKYAFCSLHDGVTLIGLASGESACLPGGKNEVNLSQEKVIDSPDSKTIWCISYTDGLWAFDVARKAWALKLDKDKGVPLNSFRTLEISPDGNYVWVRGLTGVAIYSVKTAKWSAFMGEDWQGQDETNYPPLCVDTHAGRMLCGHAKGIALLSFDGKSCDIVKLPGITAEMQVTQIVPVPATTGFLCATSASGHAGIYRLDVENQTLRKIKDLPAAPVTALAIAPDGYAWAAVPGDIVCFDPATGVERQVKPANGVLILPPRKPAGASDKVSACPDSDETEEVAPLPKK